MLYTKAYPIWFTMIFLGGLFLGITASAAGCGGDPACDNGLCDPTSDGGTTTEDTGKPDNDAGVEDAGTADSGDKPDAGKDPCDAYPKVQDIHGDYTCNGAVYFNYNCSAEAKEGECWVKCEDKPSKDTALDETADKVEVKSNGDEIVAACPDCPNGTMDCSRK